MRMQWFVAHQLQFNAGQFELQVAESQAWKHCSAEMVGYAMLCRTFVPRDRSHINIRLLNVVSRSSTFMDIICAY